jgi:hypothetical protein
MAKTKISEYSSTVAGAALNTDIASINIDEGCAPSGINNAIRALMAQVKDLQSGASGDTIPVLAGGTGSTTASAARTALSAAVSGVNTDITSLSASTITSDLTFSSTGAITVPKGTTAQLPGTPIAGMIRYNTSLSGFEGYTAAGWGSIGGGASANGAIYENKVTISSSYTLTTSTNGMSVGPITIGSGATVTVPSGQRWLVL